MEWHLFVLGTEIVWKKVINHPEGSADELHRRGDGYSGFWSPKKSYFDM